MADMRQREPNAPQYSRQPLESVHLPLHHESTPYLDHRQQDLLFAALQSQRPREELDFLSPEDSATSLVNRSIPVVKPLKAGAHKMDSTDTTFTPELLDFDDSFDFENGDFGGQMIGGLPDNDDTTAEQHEKRKIPDDEDAEAGDAKRQETGAEKGAKKPGRKPLTSEPTTVSTTSKVYHQVADGRQKRKAQNRAAQRAFRERKEAHLKDLETKVSELTKSSEADKHENGLLRAQVDRLQTELREYRKRLSLNSNSVKRSPTLSATQSSSRNPMGFQFEFPKFGSLPTAQILGSASNNNITPPLSNHSPSSSSFSQSGQYTRNNSEARSMSPATQNQMAQTQNSSRVSSADPTSTNSFLPYSTSDNMHGFASTLPQMGKNGNDPFGDLFSPSILKSVNAGADGNYFNNSNVTNEPSTYDTTNGGDSTAGIPDNRVFRFNSTSVASDSASPSMSSFSQGHTANSSCGTSPEPVNDSPATKLKTMESTDGNANGAQFSFTQLPTQNNNDFNLGNFDNFSVPQVDTFDPVLFGDYRDTNENIVGGGNFNNGFFDDSLNSASLDWGSPSNLFGILSPAAPQASNAITPSRNLISECDKVRDGGDDDYGLPGTQKPASGDSGKLISCTKIWSVITVMFSLTCANVLPGASFSPILTSRMANSIWTAYVQSFVRKLVVLSQVLWSTQVMSMLLSRE